MKTKTITKTTEKMLKQRRFSLEAIKQWKLGRLAKHGHSQRMERQAAAGRARRAGRVA